MGGTSAWQTVRELMGAAVEEPTLRPGMVSVIQTFGDRINPHPHVHALVSRGGWTRDDGFIPVPYVAPHAAQELFRHKVFGFLQRKELISEQRVELLLSWRHSGLLRPQHRPRSAGRSDRPRSLAPLHDAAAREPGSPQAPAGPRRGAALPQGQWRRPWLRDARAHRLHGIRRTGAGADPSASQASRALPRLLLECRQGQASARSSRWRPARHRRGYADSTARRHRRRAQALGRLAPARLRSRSSQHARGRLRHPSGGHQAHP